MINFVNEIRPLVTKTTDNTTMNNESEWKCVVGRAYIGACGFVIQQTNVYSADTSVASRQIHRRFS